MESVNPPSLDVDSLVGSDNEIEREFKEEDDDLEYFDTFPTREELEYHKWLLKNPRPSWVRAKAQLLLERRVRGLKVFMSNFTYECDFVILEDTSSVIDHYLGGMVLGKPFVKESRLVYDKDEGTIMFEKDNKIITYKMPHKMKKFKNIEDLNTDNIPPFIITSDDDKENIGGFVNRQSKEADHERYRCGSDPGHYSNCLNLGPEYKHDESVTKAIRCLIKMRSRITFGRHLEKIHVTWTQFGKKRDKIATLHEDDHKMAYSSPKLEVENEDVDSELSDVLNAVQKEENSRNISLNALIGRNTFPTMRVIGYAGKHEIHILIDSDSTHNFLDSKTAKKLGLSLKGEKFIVDMMIFPLGGCEMVLGPLQWLHGKQVEKNMGSQAQLSSMILCVYPKSVLNMVSANSSNDASISKGLQTFLADYYDVFAIPKERPPIRSHDHIVPLMEGHSQSPFSSPIVMVKKKDGSWKMCVDYRQLNKHTIKDKFPITLIEELINEVCSSKSLMNKVFKPFLRKFTLVSFDNILVYSPNMQSHTEHLRLVLQTMRQHHLKAKFSKCVFGASQVESLGHITFDKGVAIDPTKIHAMKEWLVPKTLKQLKGFLGLTGYYRRFINTYVVISYPLTKLLRKNTLVWNNEAAQAFEQLKQAMMATLVLKLPNFEEAFIVETDALVEGIGVVLQQQVLQALDKWRGYLLDKIFKINTDHLSLKYLWDQRISTPTNMKWLPKLMGFDYEIKYKNGKDNAGADALSRVTDSTQLIHMLVSTISSDV
ncbi:gypsy/ty3 retroelement polyprotein [Tanacetum coccineum]|uniref:Gypsy/ty3 retroelement polyprotein n=1 Tax=Tanacetum coccineum TaxID=301880 RepID=A0ABQ5CE86_9ASTR